VTKGGVLNPGSVGNEVADDLDKGILGAQQAKMLPALGARAIAEIQGVVGH